MEISRRKAMYGVLAASATGLTMTACGHKDEDWMNDKNRSSDKKKEPKKAPKNVDSLNGFLVTRDGRTIDPNPNGTDIHIYLDPHCPWCAVFHKESKEYIDTLVNDPAYNVYFVVMSFLDSHSNDKYSSRAANALVTVGENVRQNFYGFLNYLFDNQPGSGPEYKKFSNEDLVKAAQKNGVSYSLADLFSKNQYGEWITSMTKKEIERKDLFSQDRNSPNAFSTPSALIGGKVQKDGTYKGAVHADFSEGNYVDNMKKAIEEVRKKNS